MSVEAPPLKRYFADLHIHLGQAGGCSAVKVSAARGMTLQNVIREAGNRKGLAMVGVVDMATRGALEELEALLEAGCLTEAKGGGFLGKEGVCLIPGAEVDLPAPQPVSPGRAAHFIAYLPTFASLKEVSIQIAGSVKNPCLSTQRSRMLPAEFVQLATSCGGFVCPAHVFTPHRGVYGCMSARLADILPPELLRQIPAVELGLSADAGMADMVSELHRFSFLTNSDAHSLSKIGREHNELLLARPSFAELLAALKGDAGRRVLANYGLDPRLGKYHRTQCQKCGFMARGDRPALGCPDCGSPFVVPGVYDRLLSIADTEAGVHPPGRAPYRHQVPLEFIPGLGPRSIDLLIDSFGSEMAVLHEAQEGDLSAVVGAVLARQIIASRKGRLPIEPGGGGVYGKVRS